MKIPATALAALLFAAPSWADPLTCDLAAYKAAPDLNATVANNALTVAWSGDRGQ